MKGLTKRQNEILGYIKEYIDTNGYSPSFRDIGSHFNFSSIGTVYNHIKVLKRKGALEAEAHSSRSLSIPSILPEHHAPPADIELPFIGYISAGESIDTFPQIQSITVPLPLVPSPQQTYALRNRGNSLVDELIADGDLILVEAQSDPQPGNIIMGTMPQQNTFIKRYFPEGNYVRLESRNSEKESLIVRTDEIVIQGTVVGLIRFL